MINVLISLDHQNTAVIIRSRTFMRNARFTNNEQAELS